MHAGFYRTVAAVIVAYRLLFERGSAQLWLRIARMRRCFTVELRVLASLT